jgi:hypothetical protein
MPDRSTNEREERALDALLVTTLRRIEKDDELIDLAKLPELTEEERAAAASVLDDEFIMQILAGGRPLTTAPKKTFPDGSEELALSGSGTDYSFNRAEVIDDATLEELDRQQREALERKAERERKERERKEGGSGPIT